ncbi:hypothetical protein LLEC1_03582 [Akanthomyces lecanii]|uniref:Bicarbonate transporter-like transmembrane domain-containing protein n=1 Tax=Cordyceps confragosa TaxID=2714763 RepID=A0A179I652_CORDF|nr:hypothetical protein LLEC1_03582 [Akanthomyces lecanii]
MARQGDCHGAAAPVTAQSSDNDFVLEDSGIGGVFDSRRQEQAITPPPVASRAQYFVKGGRLRPLRLLKVDFRNLRSRYVSDWTMFNQQIVASAIYIFFTNILPGITFASDLYVLTGKSWGTIEVVFSTGLCGLAFALLSAQPLCILGVTGPFSVLAENIYKLCNEHFRVSLAAFLYAVIGAFGTCIFAVLLSTATSWRPLFHRYVRLGLSEYAAAISIIVWIGIPHIGELASLDHERLEIQTSFRPTNPDRKTFFVEFWKLPAGWIFLSIIPGAIITVLFYFDHEISSIICTVQRYGTRKPGGFAWDIALLGSTTILCGILGIPPANGLLPQAPLHSESLMHYVEVEDVDTHQGDNPATKIARTYEQRFSPFLQAAFIMLFVSPPFQKVLGLTPTSVLAGLFMFMGYQSLTVNPILQRIGYLLTPPFELAPLAPNVKWLGVHSYTAVQIVLTGIIFGITLTVAAPAFPLIIIALVPLRLTLMNKIWSRETLRAVDGWACRPGKPEDSSDGQGTPNNEKTRP